MQGALSPREFLNDDDDDDDDDGREDPEDGGEVDNAPPSRSRKKSLAGLRQKVIRIRAVDGAL